MVNLTFQSEAAIENLTAVKTELYLKEVELLSQAELLGESAAAVVRLRSAVDKLRTLIREIEHGFVEFQDSTIPLKELPALGVRYMDLATELGVHDAIYAFLRSQYESTRIEENARESAFQIVEAVEVPLRKSRPGRALICIVGTVAAFLASILAAFTAERFKRARVRSRAAPAARRDPPGDRLQDGREQVHRHDETRTRDLSPSSASPSCTRQPRTAPSRSPATAAKRPSHSASACLRRRRCPMPSCWPRC